MTNNRDTRIVGTQLNFNIDPIQPGPEGLSIIREVWLYPEELNTLTELQKFKEKNEL